jgi:hypothetical protein
MMLLTSPAGEYIGEGQTYYTTSQADITISGTPLAVTIVALGFTNTFAGPSQADLAVGPYSNAVQHPFNGSSPGLNVTTNGRSCTNVCGSFQVYEIQSDTNGQVVHFWATFSQKCNCGIPPLTGEIRYNSLLAPTNPLPRTLHVPADFATIQAALDGASGLTVDTVLVAPGLYQESVNFGSKSVHLVGQGGTPGPLIMAPAGGSAVTFLTPFSPSVPDALLCGFVLTNSAVGVLARGPASPTIASNLFWNCGTGIYCEDPAGYGGSPIVRGNTARNCTNAAVVVGYGISPLVEANSLEGNGAGIITVSSAGSPTIRNNTIRHNLGDGLTLGEQFFASVVQNLIVSNGGNGISLAITPYVGYGAWVFNNTIVDNGGAAIAVGAGASSAGLINNILVGDPALSTSGQPLLQFNDIYSRAGTAYFGMTNLTGVNGNLSADPFFTCEPQGDFHLLPGSPCIDAGTNGVPTLLSTDLDGNSRILPGDTNASTVVDMGAFEFSPSNPPTPCVFLFCPSNLIVVAPAGQDSAVVDYLAPFATPGAFVTNWPPAGSAFPVGDDLVSVSAVYGTSALECTFNISVFSADDFATALSATNLSWVTNGDASWFVETAVTHNTGLGVQSGAISTNQTSLLQTTLTGPGALSFWWKVSSSANHGLLLLSVNGATQAAISGEVDWQPQTVYFAAGTQAIAWAYSKDAGPAAGRDAGWLDQVTWLPGPVAPFVTQQPADVSQGPGLSAMFSVVAAGVPPLTYQWQFNSHTILGATNAALVITNVLATNVGTYRVLVMNSVGTTFSSNATLTLARAVAWGINNYGQTNVPPNLTNVAEVAGGWHHSVALRTDGTVTAWGDNNAGQTNVPAGLSNVVAIASRSGDHSMALKADGTVVVWGDNSYAQRNVPPGLSNVVAISAGGYRCLALRSDGTAVGWGDSSAVPAGASNLIAVSAGDAASLFLRRDGTVAAVGIGVPGNVTNIVAIAAGGLHNLALRADGIVVAWGDNSYGQSTIPVGLSNVVAIAAGDYHSTALRADGTVVVWGKYYTGSSYIVPTVPTGLTNVLAVAAGSDHDLAFFGNGSPLPALQLANPTTAGGQFSVAVPTLNGRAYRLEYKNSLSDPTWTGLYMIAGNGGTQTLSDSAPPTAQRFYRVSRW